TLPVGGGPVAETSGDVAVEAVLGHVQLAADEPAGERQVPVEDRLPGPGPLEELGRLAGPEALVVATGLVVEVGGGHQRIGAEPVRRREHPLLHQVVLDRGIARAGRVVHRSTPFPLVSGSASPASGHPTHASRPLWQAAAMPEVNPTDATDDPNREVLSWEQFGVATRELAEAVAAEEWRPDLVVAVARGGLTVAGALSYALGVKNCGAINVEFYTGVDARLDVPVVLPPSLDLVDVTGLNVLVV